MKLRAKLIFGVLGVFLLLGLALFLFRKSGESALEKYKAELRAKGEKLTFAELLPAYDATEDRFHLFVEAATKLGHPHIAPGSIHWTLSESPSTARPLALAPNPINNVAWNDLAQAVAANSENLEKIRSFLRTPPSRMNIAYDWSLDGQKLYFIEKRLAAQWLSAAVLVNMHSDNASEGIRYLSSMFALAQMHSEEPNLVNQMVRVAILHLACDAAWELLAHREPLGEPELKVLQESMEKIDLLDALEKGMTGERNFTLPAFEYIRKDSGNLSRAFSQFTAFTSQKTHPTVGDHMAGYMWRHSVAAEDELFYLRYMQGYLEIIRSLRREQSFFRTYDALMKHESDLKEIATSWRRFKYPFTTLAVPHFIKAHQTYVANETRRRLTLTAVALKRYQVRNGHFPPDLNALVPEYLAAIPIDCLDGKPLRYKLEPAGTFVLYSVGKDGEDNGGDPTPIEQSGWSDIGTGRDIVWPKPVY